jgi:hypothetical protein
MRKMILTFICLFILPVPSTALASATPDTELTRVAAGIPTACWYKGFPLPSASGYFQSAADGRTDDVGGPDGINVKGPICTRLHRVLDGWRPKARSSQIQTLTWDIYVLTHEMGHATANQRGEDLWSEQLANAYGRGPAFERAASQLGLGPYVRRQLRSALQRVGLIYG